MPTERVEVDETFIGGRACNVHKHVRARQISGTGGTDKTIVAGALHRDGKVRAEVILHTRRATLHGRGRKHVAEGLGGLYRSA